MSRVLRNTSATLAVTFEADGTPVAADGAVTVTVTRADGTVVTTAAPTTHTGDAYTYVLAPQADLTVITATWSGTFSGAAQTITTTVEIVGGFFFTLAQLRGMGLSAGDYSPRQLAEARTWIEDLIDREVGTSFVSRYRRAFLAGNGGSRLILPDPYVRRIIGASVNGVALTAPELAALTVADGIAWNPAGWQPWSTIPLNIAISYESGWGTAEEPPADVRSAALTAAKAHLLGSDSGLPARARGITNEFGNISLGFAGRDHPTGIDEVDAVIIAWRDRLRVPAIA